MSNKYPPGWGKNATTPTPPSETIFNQEYQPDWPSIPAGFDWVTVDSDGEVSAYSHKPFLGSDFWLYNAHIGTFQFIGRIDAPPGDHWKTMLYQRPTNTAA